MKSPHYFIVRPHQGVRYNASKNLNGKDFIMSSSQEDHRYTNRIGVVVSTPIGYSGEISEGDLVVVHHNVFKYYSDIHGNERSGRSHLFDSIFLIDDEIQTEKNKNHQCYQYERIAECVQNLFN